MYKSKGPKYSRMEQVKLMEGNLLKILLGPFLNNFFQIFIWVHGGFIYTSHFPLTISYSNSNMAIPPHISETFCRFFNFPVFNTFCWCKYVKLVPYCMPTEWLELQLGQIRLVGFDNGRNQ